MSIYGCNEALGTFTIDVCPDVQGRVRGWALIDCSVYSSWVDWTDKAEWDAAILAGTVKLFQLSSGSLPASSETEAEGHGDTFTQTISYEYNPTLKVRGLTSANRDFMNALNKSTVWQVALLIGERNTTGARHIISTVPTNFSFSPVAEEGLDTFAQWEGTAKWKTIDLPLIELVPTGLYT